MHSKGFSLGMFWGIRVVIEYSWLLIFALVTINLATSVFPFLHPEWGLPQVWPAAVMTSLLFFFSVLVHEFAHALTAKSKGISVKQISLFFIGGVAQIESEPQKPQDEILVAIAGPLASFAISIIALLMGGVLAQNIPGFFTGLLLTEIASLGFLPTILLWLGPINMLIGLFNLIPGFPLDGGRILHGLLWMFFNDREKAGEISIFLGRAVAVGFVVSGISMMIGLSVPLLGTGIANGIWMIVLGWFLHEAVKHYVPEESASIIE